MSTVPGILDKGGNLIALFDLSSSYAPLTSYTAGTNCLNLGQVNKSDFELNTSQSDFKNEAKQVVYSEFEYTGKTTGIVMETDKTKMDYLAFTVKDNKPRLQYKLLGTKAGKVQESFAIGLVKPQMKISGPGGATSCPYEFTASVLQAAVTFSATDVTALETALSITITATTFTIAAGAEHVILET